MRRAIAAGCTTLAFLGLLPGCTVTEAEAENSPFLEIEVPLRVPEPPGARRIEVARTLWTTLGCEQGARREVRLRLDAVTTTEDTIPRQPQVSVRVDDGDWSIAGPTVPGLDRLLDHETERVALAWIDDPLHPGRDVAGGASWVLDVRAFLDSAVAGPLRGLQVAPDRSSGYAHATGLLPYDDSLIWKVEGHLRLAPLEVPAALSTLLVDTFGDDIAALTARAPDETHASIQLRQRSSLPEPRPADTRRDETVEFTIRWLVDGKSVEAGLLEQRTRTSP